jgi:polyhydroxyalkanoate synthesis regulator phasin
LHSNPPPNPKDFSTTQLAF